jgi:pyruvate dehydrogenase E2 component (dihydrolipoamide acetyltransferase)
MATAVNLLQLSPTMSEGTVVKWLVKEGDEVSSGTPIAEVETDKAVMEQESFEDGKVLKILVKEGEKVAVGSLLMVTGEPGEDYSALLGGGAAKPAVAAAPVAAKPEPKAAPAPVSAPAPAPAAKPAAAPVPSAAPAGRVIASPLARKIAKDAGLDLNGVSGSGPNGRIIRRDVETALSCAPSSATAAPVASSYSAPASAERIAVSGMRAVIAKRLIESKTTIPHFQLTVDVRGERLLDGVARIKAAHPDAKVTVTHFIIKAMAVVAMRHRAVRSQWAGDAINVLPSAHISVAVAIEDGLVTPVIRDAQAKGVLQIAQDLRDLASKARDRKLGAADMSGGVQTLSNLGMFGISQFNAIINPPESSILAVGGMEDRPVVENGQLDAGKVMTITLSADHRVMDGAVAAQYLQDLKRALEDPLMMLL